MGVAPPHPATASGSHFSCSLTSCIVERVRDFGGDAAVTEMLRIAKVEHSPEYLLTVSNWVSFDEAVALSCAGARVTQHPQFARAVGEDAARRLNASPVAALLRSLGSPENVYRQIATSATKYSVVTSLEAITVGPGFAEIVAHPVQGFPRHPDHCAWTCGLLSQPPILFGLPQATVVHERCAALGAEDCRYVLTWNVEGSASDPASREADALREQLAAMQRRLHSIFETAGDLIAADDISDALARITDRAGVEVRAPRYLLAVRIDQEGELHCHHKGFDDDGLDGYVERILSDHPASMPDNWLVVPVCSARRDYGRLLAMSEPGRRFFPQERDLLEVYGRYAASALDSATALIEAKHRYAQSSALLALARALAAAGTSREVARKLADAVPAVVDCDRVGVYLWDPARGLLVRGASTQRDDRPAAESEDWSRAPSPGGPLQRLLNDPRTEPLFIDPDSGDPLLRELFAAVGAVATILVPLATPDHLLGLLAVSVFERPERMHPNPDLLDRLSGVAAQATTALQNGRLVDQITYQALHDDLTGLPNRPHFTDALRTAVGRAIRTREQVAVFYIDLDAFKPVNDQWGHDRGDALLLAVGRRLQSRARANDFVARLGGDEFAVLIHAPADRDDFREIQTRLATAFAEPFNIGRLEVRIDASIGCARFPADADDAEGLLRLADTAMFAAKRTHQEGKRYPIT